MANFTRKYTVELDLDVKKAPAQLKKITANIAEISANLGKASDKFAVFKDLIDYLNQIDVKLAGLKASAPDLFNQIFGANGVDIDAALRKAIEPITKTPEKIAEALKAVHDKIADITNRRHAGEKVSIDELRDVATQLKELYALAGKTAPKGLESLFASGTKVSGERIGELRDALRQFEVEWDKILEKTKSGISAGTGGSDGGLQSQIDALQKQRKQYELMLKVLGKALPKHKLTGDYQTDVAMLDKLIQKFQDAKAAKEDFESRKMTSGDDYLKSVAEYVKAASTLKGTTDYFANNGSNALVTYISNTMGSGSAYDQAERFLKDFYKNQSDLLNRIKTLYQTEVDAINQQLAKLTGATVAPPQDDAATKQRKSNVEQLTLTYDGLIKKLQEYRAAVKANDYDGMDSIINQLYKVSNASEDAQGKAAALLRTLTDKNIDSVAKQLTSILGLTFSTGATTKTGGGVATSVSSARASTSGGASTGGKTGETVKVDWSALQGDIKSQGAETRTAIQTNIDNVINAINQLKSDIVARLSADNDDVAVQAMKSSLLEMVRQVQAHNSVTVPYNVEFADGITRRVQRNTQQELSGSLFSNGSFLLGTGEAGTVPWNKVIEQLLANLSQQILVDFHSHPLKFNAGLQYSNDMFSGSTGDIGAFRRSHNLGAQMAGLITGDVVKLIDISKLTQQQMIDLRRELATLEKESIKKYPYYFTEKDGKRVYQHQGSLQDYQGLGRVYDEILQTAMKRANIPTNALQSYDVKDDKQMTALATRLVELSKATDQALSPVQRLSEIIKAFGGDVTTDNAKTQLLGFQQGNVSAADVFNRIVGDRFGLVSQQSIEALIAANNAAKAPTTDQYLSQIVTALTAMQTCLSNIEVGINNGKDANIIRYANAFSSFNPDNIEFMSEYLYKSGLYNPNDVTKHRNEQMYFASESLSAESTLNLKHAANTLDPQVAADSIRTYFQTLATINQTLEQFNLYRDRYGTYGELEQYTTNASQMQSMLFDSKTLDIVRQWFAVAQGTTSATTSTAATVTATNAAQLADPRAMATTGIAQLETEQYELLRKKLEEVTAAINAKTAAFSNEAIAVGHAVSQEINSLQQLKEYLDAIKLVVDGISTGLQAIGTVPTTTANGNATQTTTTTTQNVQAQPVVTADTATGPYALESTLQVVNGTLQSILSALQGGVSLSGLVDPLQNFVAEMQKFSALLAQKTQDTYFSKTGVATDRITDGKEYAKIQSIAFGALGDQAVEKEITGVKALENGIVQVNGVLKTAQNEWKSFSVQVTQAGQAEELVITKNKKLTEQAQQFATGMSTAGNAVTTYEGKLAQLQQAPDGAAQKLEELKTKLGAVTNSSQLSAWNKEWDALVATIDAAVQKEHEATKLVAAQTRISDAAEYAKIASYATKSLPMNSYVDKSSISVQGMEALENGLVRVTGVMQSAENEWKTFIVTVDQGYKTAVQSITINEGLTASAQAFNQGWNNAAASVDAARAKLDGLKTTGTITENLAQQVGALEAELLNITTSDQLNAWLEKWKQVEGAIDGVARKEQQAAISQQDMTLSGILNSAKKSYNSLHIDPLAEKLPAHLEEARDKYQQLALIISQCKENGVLLTEQEINGLKALAGQIRATADQYGDMAANRKSSYGTAQATNATAKYNNISQVIASNPEFAQSTVVQQLFAQYEAAYNRLIAKQREFANSTTKPTQEQITAFKMLTQQFNEAGRALNAVITSSQQLSQNSGGTPYSLVGSEFDTARQADRIAALRQAVDAFTDGKAQIGSFNKNFTQLNYTVDNGNGTFTNFTATLNAARTAIYTTAGETKTATTRFSMFMGELKNKARSLSSYLIMMGSFYRIISQIRQGITYIKEIDTALTELKKVTDATSTAYDNFLQKMSRTANVVGSTVKDLTSSAADWARLGYSLAEAGKLAENTAILMNVSEFDDVSKATDTLISALQAFKNETTDVGTYSMLIIDEFNEVGNNYAISTSDLADSLTRSSAALVAANNSLEESIAMTAAANTTIQNPESVGNALKTVSMRIRGVKTELEEAGEDTEGMVTNTAKLQEKIMALTNIDGSGGIDILTESGDFKSTYQILLEISKIWEKMGDTDQAALLELVAGKTRGSVVAALFQNGDVLEDAYASASNAKGSAQHELDTYLDSIAGRMSLLTNAVQTMWMNAMSSDFVKFVVNATTAVVKLVDTLGLIPTLLSGFYAYSTVMKPVLQSMKNITSMSDVIKIKSQEVVVAKNAETVASTRVAAAYEQEKQTNLSATTAKEINTDVSLANASAKGTETAASLTNTEATKLETTASITNAEANMAEANSAKVSAAAKGVETSASAANTFAARSGAFFAKGAAFVLGLGKALALTIAIAAAMKLGSIAVEAFMDRFKSTDELVEDWEAVKNNIKELNDELKTTQDRIKELESQGALSFTDKQELIQLRQQNDELERRIRLEEQAEQEAGDEAQKSVKKDYEKEFIKEAIVTEQDMIKYQSLSEKSNAIGNIFSNDLTETSLDNLTDEQKNIIRGLVSEDIYHELSTKALGDLSDTTRQLLADIYNEYQTELQDLSFITNPDYFVSGETYVDQAIQKIQEYKDAIYDVDGQLKGGLSDEYVVEVNTNIDNLESDLAETANELYDYMDKYGGDANDPFVQKLQSQIDKIDMAINPIDFYNKKFDEIFGKYSDQQVVLYELAEQGKLTAASLNSSDYSQLLGELRLIGVTAQDVADHINALNELELQKVLDPEFNIADYEDSIDALQENISAYKEALASLEDGTFTYSDFIDLTQQFPELADGVDASSKSFTGLAKNLRRAIKASPDELIDDLKSLRKQLIANGRSTTEIDQLIASIENLPIETVKDLADEYVTLADRINAAKKAQNELKEAMEENPNEGYETRGEAMEYMKDKMSRGEIGSESELWSVAEKYGFTYDSAKSINENADALAKFIAIREEWYKTDDDGNYTFKGTAEFLNDVESVVQKSEELQNLGVKWLYNEDTGTLDFDFNNADWNEVVRILGESKELAGLTSAEFYDLLMQVGQFFDISWQDADDLSWFISNVAKSSGDATTKISTMTDAVETYVEKALGKDIDFGSLDEAAIAALECDDSIKQLLSNYLELKAAIENNKLSINIDGDVETEIVVPLREAGLKVTETIDELGNKQFSFDVVDFETLMHKNGYDTESIMAVVNRIFGEGSEQANLVQAREKILNIEYASDDAKQALDELGISYTLIAGSSGAVLTITSNVDEILTKYQFTDDEISALKAKWESNGIQINTEANTSGAEDSKDALDEIPENVETTISADDTEFQKTMAVVNKTLDDFTKDRTAYLTVKTTTDETSSTSTAKNKSKASKSVTSTSNIRQNSIFADGTVHGGTAHAGGSWGAPRTETALVGELGPELLVRDGRWTTIGENGAEFTGIKKGDIIFNHRQTKQLLENGYVTSRGKAYADGTAYVSGGGTFAKYEFSGSGGYTKYDVNGNVVESFGDLSGAIDSAADSVNEFEETIDWIEIRMEEYDEAIGKFTAELENLTTYAAKNAKIEEIIAKNQQKYADSLAGAAYYEQYAEKYLAGMNDDLVAAAKNGAIAIAEFTKEQDEATVEAINNYRDYAQRAADLYQQAEEILTEIRDSVIQKIDNIQDYGNAKTSIEDAQTEKLQSIVDYFEEKGEIPAWAYYGVNGGDADNSTGMFENSYKKIDYWTPILEDMQKAFDEAVRNGQIVRGTVEWYEQLEKLYEVQANIQEATMELEEFQNAINDLYWENFDELINRLDYLKDETQSLIDLMDQADMVADPEKRKYENGTVEYWTADDVEWTKEGLASLGLYAQQMEIAEYTAKQYAEAIDDLEKEYAAGHYSENEYYEKLNELKDAQYENIQSYNEAKEAIRDLNETRIDSVKDGISKEIDAYTELIEKKKEELDTEKD